MPVLIYLLPSGGSPIYLESNLNAPGGLGAIINSCQPLCNSRQMSINFRKKDDSVRKENWVVLKEKWKKASNWSESWQRIIRKQIWSEIFKALNRSSQKMSKFENKLWPVVGIIWATIILKDINIFYFRPKCTIKIRRRFDTQVAFYKRINYENQLSWTLCPEGLIIIR